MITKEQVLAAFNLEAVNPGAWGREWIAGGGVELPSVDPTSGTAIATVRQADAGAYERVVSVAAEAFRTWRMVPAPKRGELVNALGFELRHHKEALARLVAWEMGKTLPEALGEVQEMIDMCDFAVGLSRQLYGLSMQSERPRHRMYEQWHPLGVVGVISSFNFPVSVWSWNAAIAAVCGDTVVWKPSSHTPLTSIAVQHICNHVMTRFDAQGVFNLAIGAGSEVGQRLVDDPRVPLISFTGSTEQGRKVAASLARRFGRSILELGGNNAVIVMDDADLNLALRAVLFAAVGTSGQRCTSLRRLILHRRIAERFLKSLVKAYGTVRIGDPLERGTLMGPRLVSEGAVSDMMARSSKPERRGARSCSAVAVSIVRAISSSPP
jgi:aldehyde dehydrogenase (NAD+)